MSEENINAITGEKAEGASDTTDWKSKYEEAQAKIASMKACDDGRVRKLDEELKARQKEIDELRAARREEEIASVLSAEDRGDIPEEYLKAAAKLVNKGMTQVMSDSERRFSELNDKRRAEVESNRKIAEDEFLRRIDVRYPGFRASIGPGGDKSAEWASYLKFNNATIVTAYRSMDFDTLSHHIETFYKSHLGVPVPSTKDEGLTPDPTNRGGVPTNGGAVQVGKVYTQEEYNALFDMKEAARSREDWAEVKRISDEINRAQAENRVK